MAVLKFVEHLTRIKRQKVFLKDVELSRSEVIMVVVLVLSPLP